jgi:glyoxylase-like metal-dependent hydrolase (beta-lactamase superfamily II)
MCPWGGGVLGGKGGGRMVCHVLLVEDADGLVLVDTGFGTPEVRDPRRLGRPFGALARPVLEEAETAVAQVRELGFDPVDVRHIVMTHLDFDHAGGLADFPGAEVHVFAREHEVAMNPSSRERPRYLAPQWEHGPQWVKHDVEGDEWLGFESVRVLPGGGDDLLMIPLPGHTRGHTGVAVRRPDGWLLHCGDAYFHRGEVGTPSRCPAGLRLYQSVTGVNSKLRLQNLERLQELARQHPDDLTLLCSHDPVVLERAQAASKAKSPAAARPSDGP